MKTEKNSVQAGSDLTELVFILDRSGSMAGLESDTIGGFNAMIEKQKKQEGKAFVTTVLFDNELKTLHDRVALEKIAPMTERDYAVGGCTALLDAMGLTIRHIADIHRYVRPEDVPAHTVFVITTDGMENASRHFDAAQVKALVEQKKEADGWEFLFLGANIDAVATAGSFGISEDRAADYHADAQGTAVNYDALSEAITCVRSCRPLSSGWKKAIEKDFKSRNRR